MRPNLTPSSSFTVECYDAKVGCRDAGGQFLPAEADCRNIIIDYMIAKSIASGG